MDFVVARELAPEPAASSRIFSIPAETGDVDLAVVRLSRFSRGTAFALGDIVAGLPSVAGMVLDLSGNGGGDRREALLALNSLVPGRAPLVAAPSPSPGGQKAGDNAVFGGLVVVLVDSGTASEAEAVAGSLQARGRAIVVGARTFGKGTTQALEPLPGDLGSILATTAYFYLPNGQSPQGFGIHPDVSLAAAKSAGPRESDHPRALLPSAIAPAIPTPYPLLPGRKALLAELRRLEAAREAEATAGRPPAAIEGTGDDTAVAGALRILADWVASASRAPAPASKEWLP
jgi:C-terminal processing protease CtpA/Prc